MHHRQVFLDPLVFTGMTPGPAAYRGGADKRCRALAPIALLALTVLCCGCTLTPGTSSGSPVAGMMMHHDPAMGYTLAAPGTWTVQVLEDQYLAAREKDGPATVIIWPIALSGEYRAMTARGVTSYAAGQIIRQFPDFEIVSIKKSSDDRIVEVVATYTSGTTPMKGVMTTTIIGNGQGLFTAYAAPLDRFENMEKTMRTIISSFSLDPPAQVKATPTLQLIQVKPEVFPNIAYPQFPGGLTVKVPPGWVAYQYQADTCTLNWWVGPDSTFTTQVAALNEIMVFSSEQQKQGLISSLENYNGVTGQQLAGIYQNIPVASLMGPKQFLTSIVPTVAGTSLYQDVYPSLTGITNLQIIGEREIPADAQTGISQVLGPQFGAYDITFIKNGVSMKGAAFTWTTNVGYGSPFWWGNIWLIAAPTDRFDQMEPELMEIFNSLEVSPQWMQSCSEVSAYMGKVRDEIYTNNQEALNRVDQKWSDVIRGQDRVVNKDTGEVYTVSPDFKHYYNQNREQFEMQNLQELAPGDWNSIPLDGSLHIR